MKDIEKYTIKLLKIKNYYIKELFDRLCKKYDRKEVCIIIKKLINEGYINDKILTKLKLNFLINQRLYGINYIYNYFDIKNVSNNLVNYLLKDYSDFVFERNKKKLIIILKEKGKTDKQIESVLLNKGYNI